MFRRVVFTMFVLAIIGCDDRTAVVEPEPTPNQPPVIDRVILPTIVEANTPVKLQIIARDADQDSLTIIWEASEGPVQNDVWTPPDRAAQVVITVHVTDGKNEIVTQTKNITVTKEPTPEPELSPLPELPPLPESQPPPQQPTQQPEPEPEPPQQPAVEEAWNIIPRVGIEHVAPGKPTLRVNIGDTIEQVSALIERTEWVGNNQVQFHHRLGQFHCHYKDGKVAGITVDAPRYKTPDGFRVGMHIDDVIAKYGKADEISGGVQFTFYMYFAKGYMFSVTRNGRIAGITVTG